MQEGIANLEVIRILVLHERGSELPPPATRSEVQLDGDEIWPL